MLPRPAAAGVAAVIAGGVLLNGLPAALAQQAPAGGTAIASQTLDRGDGTTAVLGQPMAGSAFSSLAAPVAGTYAATLTLSSAGSPGVTLSLEGNAVAVPAFSGTRTLTQEVQVRDGWLDLSITSGAQAVHLASFTARPVAAAPTTDDGGLAWQRVYQQDFTDLRDVAAFQSPAEVNGTLRPTDSTNALLQKPSVRANVGTVADSDALDGSALGVHTRRGSYETPTGPAYGWTNGRMAIKGQDQAPPVRIRTRLRLTSSAYAKSAVMWWPAGGGWPWEVDFVETFGGTSTTDYWGSRQRIAQRWHADLDGNGQATEQLHKDLPVDATRYHVYDLFITPDRMWLQVDGVTRMETTDRRFIPTGNGFFAVGKASTHRRDMAGRTDDGVFVDFVEIYRPA